MKIINNFFFFIDVLKENENLFLKTNNFFKKNDLLLSNKFFVPFIFDDKKIFSLLEKNEKFLSFFFLINKFFFKNQVKNLKTLFNVEKLRPLFKKIMIFSIYIYYYYYKFLFSFIFILKKKFNVKKKNG